MSKAFVDTTIIADRLLKPGEKQDKAKAALAGFSETILPVYAIREFRGGAFRYYIWAHNKLVEKESIADFIDAANAMGYQAYLKSTAFEALAAGLRLISQLTNPEWKIKYGERANPDTVQLDNLRLQLRSLIHRAWKLRRKITSSVVDELPCFQETGIEENRGMISFENKVKSCGSNPDCAIAKLLLRQPTELEAVFKANENLPKSAEQKRRRKGLRHLNRTEDRPLPEDYCRGLGDAVFALTAPIDSVILTTNSGDHTALAGPLGKIVEVP